VGIFKLSIPVRMLTAFQSPDAGRKTISVSVRGGSKREMQSPE